MTMEGLSSIVMYFVWISYAFDLRGKAASARGGLLSMEKMHSENRSPAEFETEAMRY